MQNELALIAVLLLLLVADLVYQQRKVFLGIAITLVAAVTILGFFNHLTGTLFGGMYTTGPMHQAMKSVLNIGTLLVLLLGWNWATEGSVKKKSGEMTLLLLSTLIGMAYMISANHFLMFVLGLELATIPLAALAALESYRAKSSESGIKFILLAAFSSAILLFGVSMIYASTGSLYFEDVMSGSTSGLVGLLGIVLVVIGLGFKISLVPFHLWTADVYEGAPTVVTSYLSTVSKGASLFMLTILLHKVFEPELQVVMPVLIVLITGTILLGNLFALRQRSIKRFLAFSSIAQAGYLMLGMIHPGGQGAATILYFVFIYVFSNLAAFGVATIVESRTGIERIDGYKGMYHTNPKLSLTMMLAMFSLAGIPPVAGFFGKFFLFTTAAGEGYYMLVLFAVLNSIISLYYYLLVVKSMFIDAASEEIGQIRSSSAERIGLLLCVAGMIAIGFYGRLFDHIVQLTTLYFGK